ncbi:DUF4153 domain-containing protein [Butyrivibrio sp. LC3010]|uniref:DUF4153 domain-containing protein n=1 Tax=Butyrivibrio sp. LC3010 TaxID=1280680 RepID=UPI00040510F2|nr:DUF4173 domain-containing protein [Butyrivibrio sp. LC3010]
MENQINEVVGNNENNNSCYNNSNLAVSPVAQGNGPTYHYGNMTTVNKNAYAPDAESFAKYGLIALIYAAMRVFCLYSNQSGITYSIYMAGTLALIAWARRRDGLSIFKSKNGKSALNLFYIISLMLLSVSKCMTTNTELLWLDGLAINLLMFSFVIYMYVDTKGWDIVGWFIAIVITACKPLINIIDPVNDFVGWVKSRGNKLSSENKATILAILAGLCVAIPLLAIVIPLLSSADAVFSNKIGSIFDFIIEFDYILDLVGITLSAIWSIWLFYTVIKSLQKKGIEVDADKRAGFNPVMGITFIGILSIVYLFFSVIQIAGLFMGKMALPKGYTYAQYAHEGFYQLLAVSIMNLALVTLCKRLFKENIVLKILLMVVGACTYIMIASSAYRMILYISVYHLTFMRLFVLWFLVVISLWLAYLLVSLVYEKFPVFSWCMVTVTVMYIAFVFSSPDYQIAKYDLQFVDSERISSERYNTDSIQTYLTYDLSMDAVPAFADNRELLMNYRANNYEYSLVKDRKLSFNAIREFNFSEYRARKIIEKAMKSN